MKIMKKRNQNLYVKSIDASKAFDKVARIILWLRLNDMSISFTLIYCLHNYYENFYIIIKNDMFYSKLFKTTCGFKQGGPISPDLYKLDSEIIAVTVDKMGVGIKVGRMLINIIMYADDIILVADNAVDAQTLLDAVTKFGFEIKIKFNPEKTNLMVCGARPMSFELKLCNKSIVLVDEIKYLGVMLKSNNKIQHIHETHNII